MTTDRFASLTITALRSIMVARGLAESAKHIAKRPKKELRPMA